MFPVILFIISVVFAVMYLFKTDRRTKDLERKVKTLEEKVETLELIC